MTALRVTTQLLVDRSVRNINNQTNRLLTLQEQLATGLRVNRPSDDPIDARRAVSIRSLIGKNEQYLANISMVNSPVAETNTSIETILSSFNRAWELTLRGANGTNAQSQLDALALEIDQILEGIFSTANHETNGRYLFGGTRTTAPPYEAVRNAEGEITAVNFVGNTEAVRVAISDVLDLQYNETGPDVFSETQDIFQTLIDVRDNLRAGDTGARLGPSGRNGDGARPVDLRARPRRQHSEPVGSQCRGVRGVHVPVADPVVRRHRCRLCGGDYGTQRPDQRVPGGPVRRGPGDPAESPRLRGLAVYPPPVCSAPCRYAITRTFSSVTRPSWIIASRSGRNASMRSG